MTRDSIPVPAAGWALAPTEFDVWVYIGVASRQLGLVVWVEILGRPADNALACEVRLMTTRWAPAGQRFTVGNPRPTTTTVGDVKRFLSRPPAAFLDDLYLPQWREALDEAVKAALRRS